MDSSIVVACNPNTQEKSDFLNALMVSTASGASLGGILSVCICNPVDCQLSYRLTHIKDTVAPHPGILIFFFFLPSLSCRTGDRLKSLS